MSCTCQAGSRLSMQAPILYILHVIVKAAPVPDKGGVCPPGRTRGHDTKVGFPYMLVGYMRVSSDSDRQTTALQRDALIAAGVDPRHLFEDKASGARDDRPGLKACLAFLKPSDTLVVWKLDRLGRSLPHLLDIVASLRDGSIAFRSLTEGMDTNTPHGELLFHIFGALAQYERALTRERVQAGLPPLDGAADVVVGPSPSSLKDWTRSLPPLMGARAKRRSAAPSASPGARSSTRLPAPAGPAPARLGDPGMPVSFLTPKQERRYGRFNGVPTQEQLDRHFHLDDSDLAMIGRRRWDHMRLGFAVQLGTVRFLGAFLADPTEVPAEVVANLARQIGVADPACLGRYCDGKARWHHAAEIRHVYGYREFAAPAAQWRLLRWLYALCWTGTDRPTALFDRATAWLVAHKVLLPGASVLERTVARVRSRANSRLWRLLAARITPEQKARLDALLTVPEGGRQSPLDRLRSGPTLQSTNELVRATERLGEVRRLAAGLPRTDRLPKTRVLALARFAGAAKAQAVARLPGERRAATLLAFLRALEASAQDDVPDLFDLLVTRMFVDAVRKGREARLRGLGDLDAAALTLSRVCALVLLSVVLEQETELEPTEIMTDTGAYTDVIFGIFWLLGYQFSPRIADVGGARFWRVDAAADYGPLDKLAAHKVRASLVAEHWDDLLRLAGSLKLGLVQAGGLMRTLQTNDRPTRLARALEELGRIVKTLYLLAYIDDEAYRRRILTQLNRGEGRHQLARAVFHGKRGELRQRYREGQEDQLGALGLVVNAIILWNTIYIDAALDQLRAEGFDMRDEDVARLSPLAHEHVNMLGRYAFTLPEPVARGELRPLRSPAALVDDDA